MASPHPLPSAPPRSQAQRIRDLTRERDRISTELIAAKKLLGHIRDAVFNPDWGTNQAIAAIRQYLVDGWETATPPGKVFDLMRSHDGSGVSGSGRVAEGFEFENGKVVMCWLGAMASINMYESIDHVKAIHGHGGSTEVVYR
jgi:hypothetical protein